MSLTETELKLFFSPKDRLRLTVGNERSYPTVKPAWASPLTYPERFLSLQDGKGDEIVLIDDPKRLPKESLEAVNLELSRRYLTATIEEVEDARSEFGVTYWHVKTNRGMRDFVTQSLQENAQWLSPDHLLLIDVDGNRFELKNVESMDERSRAFLATIL
jgi:hypothetical protein